jgi:deoxyribonuclease-4
MYGSHLSIAGDMTNALREAESLGMDTVQVFTKNQQQWKAKPLAKETIDLWRSEVRRLGWGGRTVSHASYLINLASPDDELWEKSVALMRDEIERCEILGIPFLVHHPGSFTTSSLEQGLNRIIDAYVRLFKETKGYATVSCLEGTVGGGNTIGGKFEHLSFLRDRILEKTGSKERVGVCLDTCHLHAAGYDMSTRESAALVFKEFDRVCGMSLLRVMHINDSKGGVGSKLDRHTHIGCGLIGRGPMKAPKVSEKPAGASVLARSGFAAVVNHPAVRGIPKILETPKDERSDGKVWDRINLKALRGLIE